MPWRRKWHPTPVLLPGKSHGRRILVGYSPWGSRVGRNWATSLRFLVRQFWGFQRWLVLTNEAGFFNGNWAFWPCDSHQVLFHETHRQHSSSTGLFPESLYGVCVRWEDWEADSRLLLGLWRSPGTLTSALHTTLHKQEFNVGLFISLLTTVIQLLSYS